MPRAAKSGKPAPDSCDKEIPRAIRNQIARLFGASSKEAGLKERSSSEWRKTLRAILTELDRYCQANVHTDQFHEISLCAALASANHALNDDDYWPGYTEGIIRFALLLMGDYPDHHARKKGKRRANHYDLNLHRTLSYSQNPEQKKRTLFAAWKISGLPKSFDEVIGEFRSVHGYTATAADFIQWFKKNYPTAYTAVF